MRWLLDEMLPRAVAEELNRRGHEAVSVLDFDLAGADDPEVFSRAAAEDRVLVTENFGDCASLLSERLRTDEPCVPVIFVHKPDFPRGGALAVHLAEHLHTWAAANPDPYVGPHWRSGRWSRSPDLCRVKAKRRSSRPASIPRKCWSEHLFRARH